MEVFAQLEQAGVAAFADGEDYARTTVEIVGPARRNGFVGDGREIAEGNDAAVADAEVEIAKVVGGTEVAGEADGVLVMPVVEQESAEFDVGPAQETGQRFLVEAQRAESGTVGTDG